MVACDSRVSEVLAERYIVTDTAPEIVRLLRASRVDLSTEKHMQEGVEQILQAAGVNFEREKRLGPRDIPDFFLTTGGIILECKVRDKARKISTFKQLERYASFPEVKGIILAANLTMGLPDQIMDKPAYFASLSTGWL